jgi:hypothetical protein
MLRRLKFVISLTTIHGPVVIFLDAETIAKTVTSLTCILLKLCPASVFEMGTKNEINGRCGYGWIGNTFHGLK